MAGNGAGSDFPAAMEQFDDDDETMFEMEMGDGPGERLSPQSNKTPELDPRWSSGHVADDELEMDATPPPTVSAAQIVEAFSKLKCATKPTPASFDNLSCIGAGAYGKVFLVKKNCGVDSGRTYAMKVLRKDHIVKSKTDIKHTNAERNILAAIRHPMIVDLHYAFQTETKLYLVLQYVGGGDLFRILDREGNLTERAARFYVAELICALEHIHSLGVVYRDLKPENILLETSGHIRLTDFGLAKKLQDGEKTNTICGTYEYMAPEVVRKVGHDYPADYWSLGALLYDMVIGVPPFSASNRWKLMEKIVSAELPVPPGLTRRLVSLLGGLMNRSVRHRLGSKQNGGVEKLKNHSWFKSIDWDDAINCRLPPPFVPVTFSENDTRNFDTTFTSQLPQETPESPGRLKVASSTENPFQSFSYIESNLNLERAVEPQFDPRAASPEPPSGYATPTVARSSPVTVRAEYISAVPNRNDSALRVVSEPPLQNCAAQQHQNLTDQWLSTSSMDSIHASKTKPAPLQM